MEKGQIVVDRGCAQSRRGELLRPSVDSVDDGLSQDGFEGNAGDHLDWFFSFEKTKDTWDTRHAAKKSMQQLW